MGVVDRDILHLIRGVQETSAERRQDYADSKEERKDRLGCEEGQEGL